MKKLLAVAVVAVALTFGCAGMGLQAGVCTGGSGVVAGYNAAGADGSKARVGVQVNPNCGPAGVSMGLNFPDDWMNYLPEFIQGLFKKDTP